MKDGGGRDVDLEFFGKITAGVTHEIKNKLAIIKEESGLITDLFEMANRGSPLDTARIKGLMEKIITRADEIDMILKRLNSFAHSVDEPSRSFGLWETADLTVALCRRFAAMKKVDLEMAGPAESIQVSGNPFLLQRLIWVVVEQAMNAAEEGGKITVSVRDAGESARLLFAGSLKDPSGIKDAAKKNLDEELESLGAEFSQEDSPPAVVVSIRKELA